MYGGDDGFKKIQERDGMKYKLSIDNDCKLFYFTYNPSHVPKNFQYYIFSNEDMLIETIKNIIYENKIICKLRNI